MAPRIKAQIDEIYRNARRMSSVATDYVDPLTIEIATLTLSDGAFGWYGREQMNMPATYAHMQQVYQEYSDRLADVMQQTADTLCDAAERYVRTDSEWADKLDQLQRNITEEQGTDEWQDAVGIISRILP